MKKSILENWRSYHVPGQGHYKTRARNAVHLNSNNTIEHELAKCIGGIMLNRYGDIKVDEIVRKEISMMAQVIRTAFGPGSFESHEFISEAVPNEDSARRIDIVDINTDDRFEFVKSSLSEKSKDDCIIIRL